MSAAAVLRHTADWEFTLKFLHPRSGLPDLFSRPARGARPTASSTRKPPGELRRLLLRLLLRRRHRNRRGGLRLEDSRLRQRIVQRLPLRPEGEAAADDVTDQRQHTNPAD